METQWQRFKFLLRKKRKGMKAAGGKALRVLGALVLLATLFGPMPYQPTPVAEAADLEWSSVNGTEVAAGDILMPAAIVVIDVVACPGGTVFVVADNVATYDLWRSTDGGGSWEQIQAGAGSADALRGVCSPSYTGDGAIAVLQTDGLIRLYDDQGDTLVATTVALSGTLAGNTVTEFAIAGDFDRDDEGTFAIATIANAAADDVVGIINWDADTGFDAAWTGIGIATAATITIGDGALAVGLSPTYQDDQGLAAVITFRDDATEVALECDTYGVTSQSTDFADAAFAAANLLGADLALDCLADATVYAVTAASIAIPSDFDGDAGRPKFIVGIATADATVDVCSAVTGAAGADAGCVLRRTGTAWEQIGPDAGAQRDISDIAIYGTFSDGTVIAGTQNDADYLRSGNGGDDWDESVDWPGAGAVRLAIDPSDVNRQYMTTADATNNGGVRASSDGGSVFSQTVLSTNAFNAGITRFDVASGGRLALIVEAGAGNALFATTSAMDQNTNLWRGDHTGAGAVADFTAVTRVGYAPNNNAVLYLVNSLRNVDQISKSTNGGKSFTVATRDPVAENIDELLVVSDTEVFVTDVDGILYRTTNSGGAWTKGCTLGDDVSTLAVSPNYATDKTILAGVTDAGRLEVKISVDNGATCTKVGSSNETDAWGAGTTNGILVAFDNDYANNKIVYAGPASDATDDIYRYDTDATSPKWEEMDRPEQGGGEEVTGLAVGATGTLYATTDDGDGDGVMLLATDCPQTIKSGVDENVCEWRTIGTVANDTGAAADLGIFNSLKVMAGSDTLVVLSDNTGPVAGDEILMITLTDAYLSGPTISSPLEGGSVPQNSGDDGQPFLIRFTDVPDAVCYQVQLSTEADFLGAIVSGNEDVDVDCADAAIGETATESLTMPAGALINGMTYYTRVRVLRLDDPANDGTDYVYEGPWGPVRKFSVGSVAGLTTPQPSLPLDGANLSSLGTNLSWNNPSGAAQVHIQVIPLNDDGPGINLIVNATSSYAVQAPVFGTGNYVMLPGATYMWRVRSSSATTSIGENDPSWGPWSAVRSFKTPPPNAGTIQLLDPIGGKTVTDKKPVLTWKDANSSMFYYEVQLSSDPNYGTGPQGAIAAVQHQLVHGAVASPPDSYMSPVDLAAGTYYWRIRQRVQATTMGPDEMGIAWSASQSFKVQ